MWIFKCDIVQYWISMLLMSYRAGDQQNRSTAPICRTESDVKVQKLYCWQYMAQLLLSYASGIFSVWFIKTCLLVFIVLSVSLCYFAFCKSLINEHDNDDDDECDVGKSIAASSATCIDLVDRYQVWSEGGSRRRVILSLCHHSHIFYCVPDPPPIFLWHVCSGPVLSELCPTMTTVSEKVKTRK